MSKYGQAIGFIETLGMAPAVHAADQMLKAADVTLVSYENVGSTLVTIMVSGDVAAVEASVNAGRMAAESIGKMTACNVIPRPVHGVHAIVQSHKANTSDRLFEQGQALGMIETFGLVFLLQAVDAMEKTASITVYGYENVASGYVSALVLGDVSACQAAVEAGVAAVRSMGSDVYSSVVIPTPHEDLACIIKSYALNTLE